MTLRPKAANCARSKRAGPGWRPLSSAPPEQKNQAIFPREQLGIHKIFLPTTRAALLVLASEIEL